MKTLDQVLLALSLILCLNACKKNNPKPIVAATTVNYTQLKTGNYWIYQEYSIDTFGSETALGTFDSCYIEKDTTINGQTYFILAGPDLFAGNSLLSYQYLRDSADCMLNNYGNIVFSPSNFGTILETDTISPTTEILSFEMTDSGYTEIVTAGMYTTLNYQETLLFPQLAPPLNKRYRNTRYAKNVGIVSQTLGIFYSSRNTNERQLVRYHLN